MSISGVVFLDKAMGWTSRRAVNEMVRMYSIPGKKRIKAGHGGTLDPLATGMLPILLGEATRFAELGLHAEKRYTVSFDLSYQTDTLDCEGEILSRFEPSLNLTDIKTLLPQFLGVQQQVPPVYSAIRVDGKRAHAIAREGGEVELKARQICIESIELVSFSCPVVTLDVRCSKGTYIRSLARDIGISLGLGGCVTALRRTSTGGWSEAMMVTMAQVQTDAVSAVIPLRAWLRDFSDIQLSKDEAKRFLNGQRIQKDTALSGDVVVMYEDILLGTACLKAGQYRQVLHPNRILPSAQAALLNCQGSESCL